MTEISRVPATSSAVERGDVPEVAALGKELTELFNALGITRRAYALRASRSESLVSRCLSGKKLATQDFIDHLIRSVEEHRNTPARPEVKQHLRDLRLAALKITNPAEYRLDTLRDELARSNRRVTRLTHRQEALHLLIEKKEGEIHNLRGEISQLHSDWTAEQAETERKESRWSGQICGLSAERDDLSTELEEMREDLREALRLREQAERQSEELKWRVLQLEEELAERMETDDVTELPLGEFKVDLSHKWNSKRNHEVSKALTEAAWSREIDEIIDLTEWLDGIRDRSLWMTFTRNVARLRPVKDVISVGLAVSKIAEGVSGDRARRWDHHLTTLASAAAASRPWNEIAQLVNAWRDIHIRLTSGASSTLSGHLLGRAFYTKRGGEEGFSHIWNELQSANVAEDDILLAVSALPSPRIVLRFLLQLLADGYNERARLLWIVVAETYQPHKVFQFGISMSAVSPPQRAQIFEMFAEELPTSTAAKLVSMSLSQSYGDDIPTIGHEFASRGRLKDLLESLLELGRHDPNAEDLHGKLISWKRGECPAARENSPGGGPQESTET